MTYISRTIDYSEPQQEDESLRWTGAKQRKFLETLSFYGNVRIAAAEACMSTRACYNLRARQGGEAFNMGWNAAILIARGRLVDELMMRAIDGQRETLERDEDGRVAARHRFDNRLAMGLLTRLDRVADMPVAGSQSDHARIVAQDFEAFLALVAADGTGADALAFIAARMPADPRAEAADSGDDGWCELCDQNHPQPATLCPNEPEKAAILARAEHIGTLSVWMGDGNGMGPSGYYTDFPPPDGFAGFQTGVFGDWNYQRSLSPEEQAIMDAEDRAEAEDDAAAGEFARLRWFGLPGGEDDEGAKDKPAEAALKQA